MQLEKLTPRVLRGGVAAIALVVAIVIPWFEPPPVEIRFVYSTDAKDLLEPLIARFNDVQDDVAVNPDDEDVEEASRPSGDVLEDILEGDAKPHLWMPAASTWGRLLNLAEGKEMAPEDSLSFFWSPELIGTFDSVSDDYPIEDWTDIADFATDRQPLGEGGAFRLGHTKPTSSTSGLYALLSEFSSVDPDGEPVVDDRSIAKVGTIERSVLHYGDIADDFCDRLFDYSSAYVKAFYMQETTFLKCKNEYPGLGLKEVFPDRTFIADYPAFVLNADWVGPDEEGAAGRFLEWLGEELDVAAVNAQRLRYGDPWDVGGTADDPAPTGADRSQSWESIDVPAGETLAAVLDAWPDVRKPAKVLILLEKGDMHLDSAIDSAKELLRIFIGDLPEDAAVGLDSFDDGVVEEAPTALLDAQHRGEILAALDRIDPRGADSFLADALVQSIDKVGDRNGIALIVVVSLGNDREDGHSTLDEALAKLRRLSQRRSPVQVFTISFGDLNGDRVMYDVATESLGGCADSRPEGDDSDRCEQESPGELVDPQELLDHVAGIV
jgi:Ca-activated chloride channel homolog